MTAGSVAVRKATRDDRSAALALWRALHAEHEALDPRYRLAADAGARWSADFGVWTRSDVDCLLVAEAEGGPLVGLVTAHLIVPPPVYEQATQAWVDDLFVVEAWRGGGVGSRLLTGVRTWAASAGAVDVRAGVVAANGAARAFWQAQGATDFSITVALPALAATFSQGS